MQQTRIFVAENLVLDCLICLNGVTCVFWECRGKGHWFYLSCHGMILLKLPSIQELFPSKTQQRKSCGIFLCCVFFFPRLLVEFCTSVSCLILCWREAMEGWMLRLHICMFGSWLNTLLKSKQASCRNHFCMNFRSLAWYISMFSGHLDCDHYVACYLV